MQRCAYWLIHSFSLVIDLMFFTPKSSLTSLSMLTTQARRRICLSVCIYYYCKGVDDDGAHSNRSVTRVIAYRARKNGYKDNRYSRIDDETFHTRGSRTKAGWWWFLKTLDVMRQRYRKYWGSQVSCDYRSSEGNGLAMDSAIQEQLSIPEITWMYCSSM
jgi:hypothetical protein